MAEPAVSTGGAKFPEDTKSYQDMPPQVWPDGSTRDLNFGAVAPKQFTPAEGHTSLTEEEAQLS